MDYKVVLAFGALVVGTIFAVKMDSDAVKEVSIHAVDALKECACAYRCATLRA